MGIVFARELINDHHDDNDDDDDDDDDFQDDQKDHDDHDHDHDPAGGRASGGVHWFADACHRNSPLRCKLLSQVVI